MKKAFTNSSLLSTRTLILIGALLSVWNLNLVHAQLTGTKTIPGDYATIALAVDDLNGQGVGAGGVVFNVAAGYTETIAATISVTATGTAANPITFQKSGAGANPIITSYTGGTGTPGTAVQDGIFQLVGSDYVTIDGIDLMENAANVANPETMEFGYALYKASATDGCQFVTIQNCTITLNRINNAGGTGPSVDGSRGINVLNAIPSAATTNLTITNAAGSNSNNKFYANTIQNCNIGIALIGFADLTPFAFADTNNDVGGALPANGNSILNYGGGGATSPAAAVRTLAQYGLNVSYNTINNNNGGGVNHTTTLRGIYLNTATSANATISHNNLTIKGGATTSQVAMIENVSGSTAAGNTIAIHNNTLTGEYLTATTGVFYGIFNSATPAVLNIHNNSVSGLVYSSIALTGTGVNYYIYNTGAAPSVNILNNTVSNNSRVGTTGGTTIGIFVSSGANQTVKNNTVSNQTIDGTGTTSTMYGIQTSTGTVVIDSNNVNNIKCLKATGTGVLYGIFNIGSPTNENINFNEVRDIEHSGTGTTYGIYHFSTTGVRTVSYNTVYNVNSGGTTVAGIFQSSSSPSIFKNKIYNIQSRSTGAPTVSGLAISSLGTAGVANVYNNTIGDITAPNASSSSANAPTVRGINITVTTANSNVNIAYNTVYLNASSTGANFATTALWATTSTTATSGRLNLNNNILVNLSTPSGTGNTSAYQRSSTTLTNYGDDSNTNLFYAGVPGAANLIFFDGTNALQTLAAFKAQVAPREALSVTENPSFLSTSGASANFLHINPAVPTQVESGAVNIAGITDDFDGDVRQGNPGYLGTGAAPDLGADEGEFILVDLSGPSIVYTDLTNSICTNANALSAEITDATGVDVAAGTKPRLWFKKSTEDNVLAASNTSGSNGWKYVEASNSSSPFTFTFDYTLLTSAVVGGDIIEYFVIAQDIVVPPNVGTNTAIYPMGFVPSSVALELAAFPVSGYKSFSIIAAPTTVISVASPEEVCIISDVTLSLGGDLSTGAEYQWESSPTGANNWTPIPGATSSTYTVVGLTTSTDFRAVITCGGVPIAASPSALVAVEVTSPMVLTTTPGFACGPGPVTVDLEATASVGATLNWYDVPTGGTSLGTGGMFTTPSLFNTTTFYVDASEGGGGATLGLPAALPTATSGAGTTNFGLVFEAIVPFTLNTVDVYAIAAAQNTPGTVTIDVVDGTGAILHTQTVDVTGNPVASAVGETVVLNFNIQPGANLKLRPGSRSASITGLLFEPSASAPGGNYGYPFSVPGIVTINHSTLSAPPGNNPRLDLYYYFYNWSISYGCTTDRVAVVATVVNDAPTCPADTTVCAGTPAFVLTATPVGGVYSGTGVVGGNMFDPAVAGIGTHNITYTICGLSCDFDITVSALPAAFNVTGGGAYCDGSPSPVVGLNGSELGVNYQLQLNGLNIGASVAGTGAALNFGNQDTPGTYTVIATNALSACTASMAGSAEVTVEALPETFNVTGGGSFCDGANGVPVGLSGSETNVSYDLFVNGNFVSTLPGTGAILNFGNQTVNGTYTVTATSNTLNACENDMVGSVNVTVLSAPTLSETHIEPTDCFSNDGSIDLIVTPAANYTYNWVTFNGSGLVNGQEDQSGLSVGVYSVTVTNTTTGCTRVLVTTLSVPGGCGGCPPVDFVTVSPDTICEGGTATFTAFGGLQGAEYTWYDDPIAGNVVGTGNPLFSDTLDVTTTYCVEQTVLAEQDLIYNFTGDVQTFTVPAGVTSITIESYGAAGAAGTGSNGGSAGGLGGFASGVLAVTPGDVLNIFVGGAATGQAAGYNGGGMGGDITGPNQNNGVGVGGGGGGASDVRVGGINLADRVIVAGGGGGGGVAGCNEVWSGGVGGDGGGGAGGNGVNSPNGGGGFGGTVGAGGAKGIGCAGFSGTDGTVANGGHGQGCCCFSHSSIPAGGGGGGGYVQGGGGGGGSAGTVGCSGNDKGGGGGGAGGSSYTGGVTSDTTINGLQTGDGVVILRFSAPCTSDRVCATVVVTPPPVVTIGVIESSGVNPNDGSICIGDSVTLFTSGGNFYLWNTGETTSSIRVGPNTTTTYTVTVYSGNGCESVASSTITVNPLPIPTITVAENSGIASNDGIICVGASAMLTAGGGTSYLWSTGEITSIINVAPLATTTYTVTVTSANNCTAVANITITVNPLPNPTITVTDNSGAVMNDGTICVGGNATLTASGGTSYLWSTGASTPAIMVAPVTTTTYTVTVTNANNCSATLSRTITVTPLPGLFTVTGGGAVCNTDNVGVPVGLSGSQVGVNYQLLLNGNPVGAPVAGTGAAISFGNQLGIGTYTVVATNATTLCTNNMTGSVTIAAFNCNIEISDPCVCLNNATTLTNGQFGETIKVNAPNGQVWTVTAINGLFSQFSPLPPGNPFPIAVGTNLIVLGGNMYTLTGIHIDALGYTVTVSNGRGTILSIGNSCQYPNPSITSVFPSEICLNSDPIPLVGNPGDANIVSQTFRVNGVVTNVFDPAQGVGQYTILYTVNGGVPKAFGPNDPGCIQSVSTIVNVVATPSNLNCNNQVYVSLDASCTKSIGADDVLEGSFFCYDDYIVDVDKTLPLGNGPWVPAVFNASDIGKNYQVRVTHLVSGITCWGNLKVEDKLAPALVCENFEIPCNTPNLTPNYLVNTLGIPFAQPTATDCQTITWSYIDTEADEDCASGLFRIITRKWTAVDASGNSATCDQFISLLRPTLADLTLPPNYDGIDAPGFDCGAGTYPSPEWIEAQGLQGYPYVFGLPSGCNINWAYTDVPILICDGTYKVVREWTIVNWCVGTPIKHYQVIKVSDEVGPQLACPADLTVATDPFACCATINLPDVIVTDNCSRINNISGMIVVRDQYTGDVINMVIIGGTLQDFPGNNWWDLDTLANFGWTPCLPVGTHTVTYIAEDDCGNTSACEFELTVRDLVPPVAACDETTTVAIGTDDPFDCYTSADGCEFAGVTWVKASTFDDGSYDNCNDVKFTVRRMAPYSDCINQLSTNPCYLDEFGDLVFSEQDIAKMELDSIKFYCCEVGTTQTIVLTVYQVDLNGNVLLGLDGSPVRNECMIQVEVQDKLRPICQAPAQVNVNCENFDPSLWAYGKADILDNCCLDTSRVYQGQCGLTHTANYTLFDTVCNKGTITRTFRAFDCHGQSSQCTQRVIVTYDQDYFVRFPNDVIVTQCDGTGVYGEPTFFGEDCELLGVSFEDEIFTVVPDACFKIERTWKIINWCTFDPNQPFIQVPNPNPNPVTNNPANLPGPIVSPLGTLAPWAPTNVRINPTDPQPTNFSTFYNKNSNGYEYKQIIKIIDGQAPTGTFVVPECSNQNWLTANNSQLWNEMYWWDTGIQTHDLCEEPTELCITGTDACSGSNVNIEYLLFLDLDGDGIMETVVNSVNTGIAGLGWNNVLYNNLNTPNFAGGTPRQFDERPVPANQKYGFSIQETVSGTNKTACVRWNTQQQQNTHIVPELPHGTHKIKWFITDGCGNNAEYEYTFTVKDCKAPTVVCLNGLSTNIMPTGMITLWASDFLQYTEDNCTPAGQIKIGIRKCGTGTGFPVDANGNPITNVTFDCTELGQQCVELWAIDAQGNADYCETYLIVQDNLGSCVPGNLNVSGVLKTESQEGIEEAVVNIIGTTPAPFSLTTLTDAQGLYQFAGIPQTATFAIAPEKDDNPLNGVTTFDLVLISKHILGLEPLNSPYKMIAADANKSGSITTFDIVEIRKLILGIYTELPNNTSWRFVDKSFSFPNPNNPFQTLFPEVVTVTNALVHQTGEDFTGIKIGDVNGSAVANALMQVDDRTAGTAIFDVSSTLNGAGSGDRDLKVGEIFELTFKAAQQLQGFQFTMLHSGLELLEVVKGEGVNAQNFGQFEGKTTVSVDGAQAFTLQFRATKSGKLSEMLGVSGEITRAEGYAVTTPQSPITQSPITQSPITKLGIAFRFGGQTISGVGFELYQNQPNPFVNKTFVGFHLPEAAEATLTVFDETGRVVYQQKGQFAKGENAISLDRALINTTGMLYYRLETATDSATKKMIQAK